MRLLSMWLTMLALVGVITSHAWATDRTIPGMPQPSPNHAWLQQLVGEWETETEAYIQPGQPPNIVRGTESVRPLGGFWTLAEVKSTLMDTPFTGHMTLGYDTEKDKYIGTWVDSMTGHMWQYEGTLDPSGKVLTLETEGMCPMNPGKITKFKEVIEMKDKDHKVFSSSILDDKGNWQTMVTSRAWRK